MHDAPGLHVLFATNFSEACHHAESAIEQLASRCRLTLTIANAVGPTDPIRQRRRQLDAFMADAEDRFDCRRLIVEGRDPAGDIAEVCATRRFDLVMAPGSRRREWSRLLARSFRSRLVTQCGVPLWTAATCLPATDFTRPIDTVSCLLDFDDDPAGLLRLVTAFARRVGAGLRVLTVIPPVDDGTLAHMLTSDAPLVPARAIDRIHELCGGQHPLAIDVAIGDRGPELRRLLARGPSDLLFVGRRHAAGSWFLRRTLDRLPCPVVCVDGSPAGFTRWSFQDEPQPLPRYRALGGSVAVTG